MLIHSPIKYVLFSWLFVAAIGFYPISIWGRLKLNNILDFVLLLTVLFVFLISIGRIKVTLRSVALPVIFFAFLVSWIPGFGFSNNLGFSLYRYLVFATMAFATIFLFMLPRPEVPLIGYRNAWVFVVCFISALLIFALISIGMTEHGRVTIPGYENGVMVYRYAEGVGLLPDPNVLSYGLGFAYILSLAYSGFRTITFVWFVLAILIVGSRSALLSLIVAIGFWLFLEDKFRKAYLPVLTVVSVLLFVIVKFFSDGVLERFKNPEYYVERYSMWLTLLDEYFSSGMSMFFGNGYGSARVAIGDPHNLYLSVLYDGGVLALTCLFFVYASSFRYAAINLSLRERNVAYVMLVFNLLIGLFYWQDQMFFVPFLSIWVLANYKAPQFSRH